jgi:hypothetical protein
MVLAGAPVALSCSLRALAAPGRKPITVVATLLSVLAALLVVTWLATLLLAPPGRRGRTPRGELGGRQPSPADIVACDCGTVAEPVTSFEMRLARREPAEGLEERESSWQHGPVFVEPDALVTLGDVVALQVLRRPGEAPSIAFTLAPGAGGRLARATRASVGHLLVLVVDGEVVHASQVSSEIGQSFLLLAGLEVDECCRLRCAVASR